MLLESAARAADRPAATSVAPMAKRPPIRSLIRPAIGAVRPPTRVFTAPSKPISNFPMSNSASNADAATASAKNVNVEAAIVASNMAENPASRIVGTRAHYDPLRLMRRAYTR